MLTQLYTDSASARPAAHCLEPPSHVQQNLLIFTIVSSVFLCEHVVHEAGLLSLWNTYASQTPSTVLAPSGQP